MSRPPDLEEWLRAQAVRRPDEGHWEQGFVPRSEFEAFMGRPVSPLEEVEIKRRLAALLRQEQH